jgi:hypothetical protein
MAYLDDIIVFGQTQQEHNFRLENVLNTFKKFNVVLNKAKYLYGETKVTFMGHILSEKGISPLESKLEAIKKFRSPRSVEEVRSFLGLINYHGRYIPDLATSSEPLRRLLRAEYKFEWKREQKIAFNQLRNCLAKENTLGYFVPGDITKLVCDASPVGIGAILIQEDNSTLDSRTIAYASRSLSKTEQAYYQTVKKSLRSGLGCIKIQILAVRYQVPAGN